MSFPLSASELGNLWQAYREKAMTLRMLEYFIEKAEEETVRTLLQNMHQTESRNQESIKAVFQAEGAVIPEAYAESDVNKNAPRLFDDHMVLMYMRLLSKVLTGLYSLHSGMSYRSDIRELYIRFTADTQHVYDQTTQYLMDQGVLAHPPVVPMPEQVEFVENTNYSNGFRLFDKKRPLNTVEIGLIYQALESNVTGMQLMIGFEQVARNSEAAKYFRRGKELAKKIVSVMSDLLIESDLPAPSSWAGLVTDSNVSPFSDKLMMYNTNLLSLFGLGSNSIGAAFSVRNDLIVTMGRIMADTYDFAKSGGEIMMRNGWMEEPPQAKTNKKTVQA